MAEENVQAQAPTRTDDQILPHSAWLQIGKSNILLDLQKMQKNPIFHVSVDILHNTNFFRAFTASSSVPAIYIQQFWNTMTYDAKIGEELVQGIQTFFSHKASTKKTTPLLIPYCQFTKLFIYYLGSKHNIYRRPEPAVHVMGDDYLIGNLKFVLKGEKDEVFGMTIPKHLITETIQQSPYYQQYLEMAARKPNATEKGKEKTVSEVVRSKRPALVKQPKPDSAKQSKSLKKKPSKVTASRKVHKGKSRLKLIDEDEEVQHKLEPQDEETDADLERALKLSLDSSQPQGQIEDEDADLELALKMSLDSFQAQSQGPEKVKPLHDDTTSGPSSQPQDDTSEKVVQEISSPSYSISVDDKESDFERTNSGTEAEVEKVDKEQDPEPMQIAESAEDQAGTYPGKIHEALAGTNPEPMHKEFYATAYPDVHKSLKLRTNKNVILEEPTSISGTLSTMKNLDDTHNFGDDFLNDIPTEDDQANTKPYRSRVENHGIQAKIENYVCETVNEKVQTALQAPLIQSFRDLSEAKMKELLHQRMFESGSYKSHTDHEILYNALELSMDHDHQDELHEELSKSRKRCRDDQDPPPPNDKDQGAPPPKDSEQNKKKKIDSNASALTKPHAHTSSTWTATDTRDAPSNSSKQKKLHHLEITTTADLFRPIPEEERPATPEPDWSIPLNDFPEADNSWANAFATTTQDPEENKLLRKIGDMGSFIKWFCKKIGKKKLSKSDLEGPAFNVVKGFHKNSISL
nr:hypothetical protein [Tanacetum cinerariifolium]